MNNAHKNAEALRAHALEVSMTAQLAAKGGCCGGSGPPEEEEDNGGN